MNKLRLKTGLLVAAALLVLSADVSAGAWLDHYLNRNTDTYGRHHDGPKGDNKPRQPAVAPEIDAGSGTSAIALLSTAVLLMRERARRRRS